LRRALGLALCLLALAGCPRGAPLPVVEHLTSPEAARLRLEREGMRRERLTGHVRARMEGLRGVFANADLDVLVERPARLHIAVRSFFEQPMLVLATDGVVLSLLDLAAQGGPVFARGPVDGRAFESVLPLEIWPQDLVALFLGVAPAAGAEARQLAVDARAGTYDLGLLEPQGYVSVVTARIEDDSLLRWRRFEGAGELVFDARYADLRLHDGLAVAEQMRLFLPGGTEDAPRSVRFEARDIEVNGAPIDPGAFRLEPPPGIPVRALP
jgi:hypothetical protein